MTPAPSVARLRGQLQEIRVSILFSAGLLQALARPPGSQERWPPLHVESTGIGKQLRPESLDIERKPRE
jgi:hypothetical protein